MEEEIKMLNKTHCMKWILLVALTVMIGAFITLDTAAQTSSKRLQKPVARVTGCNDNHTDCFIKAAQDCHRAMITTYPMQRPVNSEIPQAEYSQTIFYEIRGQKSGKCVFYSKIKGSNVIYSEDFIRFAMKDRGETRQAVEKELRDERKEYDQMSGRYALCSFETEELVGILNRWWPKGGGSGFSTRDFEGADCKGTLYKFTIPNQTIKLSNSNTLKH